MKNAIQHTALILFSAVVNVFGLMTIGVLVGEDNPIQNILIVLAVPLFTMLTASILTLPNVEKHVRDVSYTNNTDFDDEMDGIAKELIKSVATALVLGSVLIVGIYNVIPIKYVLTEVTIVCLSFIMPLGFVIYKRLTNYFNGKGYDETFAYDIMGTVTTSIIGIGLLTVFYTTGIIIGMVFIFLSYLYAYNLQLEGVNLQGVNKFT